MYAACAVELKAFLAGSKVSSFRLLGCPIGKGRQREPVRADHLICLGHDFIDARTLHADTLLVLRISITMAAVPRKATAATRFAAHRVIILGKAAFLNKL